jgi:hypothetical protein
VELAGLKQTGTLNVTARQYENRAADLDVLYIERLPRIAFDAPNGGWPQAGQQVIWRAHVQNWGEADVTASYRWLLDQAETTGTLTIPAGKEVTVDLPWQWEQKRHALSFEIDCDSKLSELAEHNNKLEIATDALAVGFYVDRSYADQFHEHQHELGLGDANSFADWGQRHIRHWNKMLRESYYPEAPQGALDRVRLDFVRVVPSRSRAATGRRTSPTWMTSPSICSGAFRTSSTNGTNRSISRPSGRASRPRTSGRTGSSSTWR